MDFIGKLVKKEFKGFGVYTGTIQSYDSSSGFFEIVYEDGDTEELDFSEISSLLEEKRENASIDQRPRLGRKPKKRRRIDGKDCEFEFESNDLDLGSHSNVIELNGVRENVKLSSLNVDLNEGLDKSSAYVDSLGENGNGSLKKGFDLNAGFNLNLNDEFDFNEDGSCVEEKRGCIDLNVEVSGDFDESLKVIGGNVGGSGKRECRFDLNFGVDEDSMDEVDADLGGYKSASYVMVKEATKTFEENGFDGRLQGTRVSEDVNGSNESCIELAEEIRKEDIFSNEDFRVSTPTEVLNPEIVADDYIEARELTPSSVRGSYERTGGRRGRRPKRSDNVHSVQQQTAAVVDVNDTVEDFPVVADQNPDDTGNAINGCSGPRRRGRRRKNVDANLSSAQGTPLVMNVNENGSAAVDYNQDDMGTAYKEAIGSRRTRRKASEDAIAVLETPVLRRSSRRGSARKNSPAVVDDVWVCSEAGALVEEELVKSCHESPEEVVIPPKVELPPSSKNVDLVGIPILDVFSIYSCLRSFSNLLFLSPFEFEEFVAALRSNLPSSLFDCIHVSILQILRKHLDYLAMEGSDSASNCLRSLNWDMLDLITWPLFMIEYLLIHESDLKPGFDLSHLKLFKRDYYAQPVSVKVEILRCLCDAMIEVEIIRSELNKRSLGAEPELDFDRPVYPRADKRRKAATVPLGDSCLTEEAADDLTDWNSDECCLCKMDGNLICCDGCPAAYHSKCVGIANDCLPEGDWFCPECATERNKPGMKTRKSLRGAELLGFDPHGRLYFSSCGYLLVSDASDIETSTSISYYHRGDLNGVIEALKSSETYYGGILKAIYKQWADSIDLSGTMSNLVSSKQATTLNAGTISIDVSSKLSVISNGMVNGGKPDDNILTGCSDLLDAGGNKSVNSLCMSSEGSADTALTNSENQNCKREGADDSNRSTNFLNESRLPLESQLTLENSLENKVESTASGLASSFADAVHGGDAIHVQPGTSYMNYYAFGYMASSIAEDLMQKSSEKANDNTIKPDEEIISAQVKVILKKCDKFHWWNVSSLKDDVWKEKCGWCFSCRVASEELGCLFNMSLGPIQKASGQGDVGFQAKQHSRGHLMDTVSHILFLEDRLQGLLLGPWLSPQFSGVWRKGMINASDIASVKRSLLVLESNLRHLALSAEWFKHVDSAATIGSASHIVIASRTSSKNGISKKKVRYSESESNSSNSAGGLGLLWWRGGRLSRKLFSWKSLPASLATKAARQAGCTKVPGILYPENSDFAKRTKSIAWRAAVDSSEIVEQLALQVRELESNIKWDEIENRQYLALLDKESRKSFRYFKKVIVWRKSIDGQGARYLLDFGKRRIIPEVVLKNGTMIEESSSERKKYWLNESYVPLHLLKNFEEKRIARKAGTTKLSEASGIMKKPAEKKGFSYLFARAERSENHQCGHCNKNVPIGEAVCCKYCKGFFHKRHVRKSAGSIIAKCVYTCHRCESRKYIKIRKKAETTGTSKPGKNIIKSVKVQKQKLKKAIVACKSVQVNTGKRKRGRPPGSQNSKKVAAVVHSKKVATVVPLRRSARQVKYKVLQSKKTGEKRKRKQAKPKKGSSKKAKKDGTSGRKKRTQVYHTYWLNGLKLSRKPNDERVKHFMSKRFLGSVESSIDKPKCPLCREVGYASPSNYISCQICEDWYHGEAFGLDAKKVSMLIGFRCHICRKRSPPVCPYVRATRSLRSRVVKAQNVTGVDSCDRVTSAVSLAADEMSLPQESLPHQDEQSSLPIDAAHNEENLDASLGANTDCVQECKFEGESGPLLSNGKEEMSLPQESLPGQDEQSSLPMDAAHKEENLDATLGANQDCFRECKLGGESGPLLSNREEEMSLPQESLPHQDEQSSLPIDAAHNEENLDASLDANQDCFRECKLGGESGPLLSNGKEEMSLPQESLPGQDEQSSLPMDAAHKEENLDATLGANQDCFRECKLGGESGPLLSNGEEEMSLPQESLLRQDEQSSLPMDAAHKEENLDATLDANRDCFRECKLGGESGPLLSNGKEEMSLPQESLPHQDEQSSLPMDAAHKEENLDATLDANQDCFCECKLGGESGPLLSNGKEEVDSIQTCNQNLVPRPLTLSDPDHMITENSVKSRNDDASALQDTLANWFSG